MQGGLASAPPRRARPAEPKHARAAARALLRRPTAARPQVGHPNGGEAWEPCAPGAPGAQECGLQYFADKGIADKVLPPKISRDDFNKVSPDVFMRVWGARVRLPNANSQQAALCAPLRARRAAGRGSNPVWYSLDPRSPAQVLQRARPTVSKADLEQYEKFTDGVSNGAGTSQPAGRGYLPHSRSVSLPPEKKLQSHLVHTVDRAAPMRPQSLGRRQTERVAARTSGVATISQLVAPRPVNEPTAAAGWPAPSNKRST